MEHFPHDSRAVAGHAYTCSECANARARAYHAAHRPERLASIQHWKDTHQDAIRRYGETHRAEGAAHTRAYYRRHRARIMPHKNALRRLRWAANRAAIAERRRAQYRLNPEPGRLYARRRSARKRGAPGRHNLEDLRLIHHAQRGLCAYCLCSLPHPCTVDHMTALFAGGSDWPWNLCLACRSCNSRKQARDAGQFIALLLKERRLLR